VPLAHAVGNVLGESVAGERHHPPVIARQAAGQLLNEKGHRPCVHGEVAVKLFRGRPDQGKLDVAAVSGNERREGSEAAFQFVKESCWG